jgi:transposase
MRRIVDAMLYLLRGGLPWRMLPPGFPPATKG